MLTFPQKQSNWEKQIFENSAALFSDETLRSSRNPTIYSNDMLISPHSGLYAENWEKGNFSFHFTAWLNFYEENVYEM